MGNALCRVVHHHREMIGRGADVFASQHNVADPPAQHCQFQYMRPGMVWPGARSAAALQDAPGPDRDRAVSHRRHRTLPCRDRGKCQDRPRRQAGAASFPLVVPKARRGCRRECSGRDKSRPERRAAPTPQRRPPSVRIAARPTRTKSHPTRPDLHRSPPRIQSANASDRCPRFARGTSRPPPLLPPKRLRRKRHDQDGASPLATGRTA